MNAGEEFGRLPGGETVCRIAISGGGLSASVLTYGAIIQDLRLDGHAPPLVLGYERLEHYLATVNFFGAVAGRHANRIREGRFSIDGETYRIDPEKPEAHGLHGGSCGYAHRNWSVADAGSDFVTLSLHDPDGTMGFPGTVEARCTYRLESPGTLSVLFEATTDRPTLCNLAQHSYFNLDDGGEGTVLDHRLRIAADAYLPVDAGLIPTGEIAPVAETPFDFREDRPIRHDEANGQVRYDHNFCLSPARTALRPVARLVGARSGVAMEVATTEPGLQFYAGHYTTPASPGLDGRRYDAFSAVCLEAQTWPDSPNHHAFPQSVLRPGETYRQETEFRFSRG
jgi:aldose 1-epimerase